MNWTRNIIESQPPENTRILVSDGEIITIASYVADEETVSWIFERQDFKDIKILWWHPLPKLPPKINPEI